MPAEKLVQGLPDLAAWCPCLILCIPGSNKSRGAVSGRSLSMACPLLQSTKASHGEGHTSTCAVCDVRAYFIVLHPPVQSGKVFRLFFLICWSSGLCAACEYSHASVHLCVGVSSTISTKCASHVCTGQLST